MKVKIVGRRVREVREALGMSVGDFADVLAVHPATVHRWESAGERATTIDGVAAGVLGALDQKIGRKPVFHSQQVGDEVVKALIVGGALFALGLLIHELVEDR